MFIRKKRTPSDTVALFDQLARRQEPRISRAFMAGLENVRDRVNATRLEQLLSSGDTNAILQLLSLDQSREDLQQFKAAINQAVSEGAKAAAESQPSVTGLNGTQVNFVFDSQNPRLAQYAQQISSTRIREISEDVRQVARNVISQDTTAGINPRETARRLRDSIGLTAKQEAAVQNYRRSLEQLDSDALRRELRDKRSDRKVRSAIENAKPLPNDRVNSLVERYRKKYVKYRAETIARTEATRSLAGAQWELFQSYIDEGRIDERQVRRFWKPTLDGRTRNEHMLIPDMNPGGVGQNEPFESMFGPIMYPGDPNARADNTINCRCAVFPRIIGLELIQNPDFDVDRYFGGPARSQPPAPPEQQQLDLPPTPQPVQTIDTLFMGRNQKEAIWASKSFSNAAVDRMQAVRKIPSLTTVDTPRNAKAFYRPSELLINMGTRVGTDNDASGQTVFRHEYGHFIDNQILRATTDDAVRRQQSYISFDAVEDLAADGKELVKTRTGPTNKATRKREDIVVDRAIKLRDEIAGNRAKARRLYEADGINFDEMRRVFPIIDEIEDGPARFLSAWRDKDHRRIMEIFADWKPGHASKLAGLSDSIESSVDVQFKYRYGHGTSYYNKKRRFYRQFGHTKMIGKRVYTPGHTTQAFANWFEAYTSGDETQLQIFKHFLPRTAAKFEKLYKEFSDG